MKAAVLFANEDIRYSDWPEPSAAPGQIKVRVRAAGICGSDVPRVLHAGAHFYPVVLGHEFSGDVVEIGENVTNLQVGDTVSGAPLLPCHTCADCQRGDYSLCKHYSFIGSREQGAFAEYVVMPAINAVRYDSVIPYAHAAMFEPSTVALHGLLCNNYQGGSDVVILGGGTIGLLTLQWAKIFGARRAVVLDLDDSRLALAKALGADHTVNAAAPNAAEEALAFTDGNGYSFVFETAGAPDAMRTAFSLAANKARLCFIGTPHTDMTFSPKLWESMNRKEFLLTGSWMSYSAPFPGREWSLTAHYLATGQLRIDPAMIFKSVPMSQAAEAFALYKTPGAVSGKILLLNS